MSDFSAALTAFLTADPSNPTRSIIISLLVGMLSAAILLLMHKRKGWGMSGVLIQLLAGMLMIIGALNFFLGVQAALA